MIAWYNAVMEGGDIMPKVVNIIVRITPEQRKRLKMYCVKKDTSLQALFTEAIVEYMKKQGVSLDE
jgi:hypothetical protein